MDGADSQSAQLPDAHPTFFAPTVCLGEADRTVFGDGGPDSSGIVRGDEPLVGRHGSSDAPWFVLVMILGRSGKGAAAAGDRDGRYGRGQALAAPEPQIIHDDDPPIGCRQYRAP